MEKQGYGQFSLCEKKQGELNMEQKNVVRKEERKYANQINQVAKVNQTTIISLTFIELLLVLALVIQTFVTPTSFGKLGIFPLIILALGVVVNWIAYLRNKRNPKLKYYMLISFLVGWVFLMVAGTNVMVSFYIYPLVVATILYHDKKFERILFYTIMAATVIRCIVWLMNGQLFGSDNISFISIIVHLEIVIVLHIISKQSSRFTEDMLGSVKDEQELQDIMLKEVLDISENVQQGVSDTNALVEHLRNDASLVHDSIEDISGRTQRTVESVQEQSQMTKQINNDIEDTAENAQVMVEVATMSANLLKQNMTVIDSIRKDADTINETNSRVAASMEDLQKKAKEVQQITEVIFTISSQTNLLALNASIESARAGEAGKGFAVVADQIRNLAEETRKSTEQIANIVEELNENAQVATDIVQCSINAMEAQNEKVANASDGFGEVQSHITTLAERVENINEKIANLVHSNNTIIENINQLSDSSASVSESAKEVEVRSLQNQTEAEQAKELLGQMQTLVQQLEKYQK